MTSQRLNTDEFNDLWANRLLPEKKIVRLEKSINILLKTLDIQINKLNKFNNLPVEKNVGFIYFFETVKTIQENGSFALSLGKSKNRRFIFYPVRTIFENTLQIEYYCKQKKDGQDKIAISEVARLAKLYYDREMDESNQGMANHYKETYESVVSDDYPPIDKAKIKDDFPNFERLTEDSNFNIDGRLYFAYRNLAESTHGKLIARIISNDDEQGEYIRGLMHLSFLMIQVLKIIDAHIQGATKNEVTNAIERSEDIVKAGIK
jgi:hypothetical protein